MFCNGKTVFNDDFTEILEQTNGQVVVFDGATGEEKARVFLDAQAGASSLGQDAWHDATTNQMFFVQGSELLVFDTNGNELLKTIEIEGEEQIGGVAYDPVANQLYVARITDFTSSGFVSIHDMEGAEVGRFTAGVAPAFVALYPEQTTVSTEDAVPGRTFTALGDGYPNPTRGGASIPVSVESTQYLRLQVFNALGQQVAVLMDGVVSPGEYVVEWQAENLPRGTYFYRLSSKSKTDTKLITLVR